MGGLPLTTWLFLFLAVAPFALLEYAFVRTARKRLAERRAEEESRGQAER